MSIFKRADGTVFESRGYKPSGTDGSARQFLGSSRVSNLPPKVDLRPFMTDIENQEQTNSCVANAVAGAYEYLVKAHLGDDAYDVSRLFIYYNSREHHDSDEIKDEGTAIVYAMRGLAEHGACSEETWPFDQDLVNTEPDEDAYDEAANFLVEDIAQLPLDLDAWRGCLAEGYPVVFGLLLYKSFDQHRKRGLVPVPSPKEAGREAHGGHAMLCVGYSDPDEVFIVRNSWGEKWGDKGYCYIPYRYMLNPKFNGGDSWLMRRVEELDLNEDSWGDDTEMIDDVETEIGQMSDEDYEALIDACDDVPLEVRVALLLIRVAAADGEIDDDETDRIVVFLDRLLEAVGRDDLDAEGMLDNLDPDLFDEDLIQESAELLGEYFTQEGLAAIWEELNAVAEADGEYDEDEDDFIFWLAGVWQVSEGEDAEDDEDDDDYDGDYDDDEEYDEDDEDYGDEDDDDEDWDDEDDEDW